MKPTIHLHIGAHKTATTFLQNLMLNLLSTQTRAGAYTLPLRNMRASFSDRFSEAFKAGRLDGVLEAKNRLLDGLFAGFEATGLGSYKAAEHNGRPPICVVSDENFLGHLVPIVRGKGLYPLAGTRATALMQIFADYDVRVFMSIRNYRDFYPSAYAQSIKHVPKLPFEKFAKSMATQKRGWVDVVQDVEAVVGKEQMFLWNYEEFAKHPAAIFKVLAPGLQVTDKELLEKSPRNTSVGRKTLEVVERLRKILTAEELKAVTRALAQFDSNSSDKLKFTDEALANDLSARYAADNQMLVEKGFRFVQH
jgi:hypothetical protein